MVQNWEDWLIHQRVVLLFGGTSTGCRNGLMGTSCSSAKRSAKSCTWGGINLCSSICRGCQAGRQLCGKGSGVLTDAELSITQQYALEAKVAAGTLGCIRMGAVPAG